MSDDSSNEIAEETIPTSTASGWSRRTFLKAAALGTAAAAFLQEDAAGGLHLGPLGAAAGTTGCVDLSGLSCTAQDVTIVGSGIVLNPCDCTGSSTFNAQVQFTVQNNTSTGRYCIDLNFPTSSQFGLQCVILENKTTPSLGSTANPGTNVMVGTIANFPCNAGLVCVSNATLGWSTSSGSAGCTSPTKVPGGQCRHQTVCIVGFAASLDCGKGPSVACTADCTGNITLTAGVFAATQELPVILTLTNNVDSTTQTKTISTVDANNHATATFPVTVTKTTTFTLTATDVNKCARTATDTVNFSPLANPTFAVSGPDCSGKTTLTASPSGLTSYTWYDGPTQLGTGSPLPVTLAPGDHSISVTVTNSLGCAASSAPTPIHVNQPVKVSAPAVTVLCTDPTSNTAAVTLSASASGGNGSYTYEFFNGTTSLGTGSPLTVQLAPGTYSNVTVTASDTSALKCSATAAAASFTVNQAVGVALGAPIIACTDATTGTAAVTISATPSGGSGSFSYVFSVDGTAGTSGSSNSLTTSLKAGSHTIGVTATDALGCSASTSAAFSINQAVSAAVKVSGGPDCSGVTTLTATAGGGSGTYTYQFFDGATSLAAAGSSNTLTSTFSPGNHSISVVVTDSLGCSATSAPINVHINQPVTLSMGAPTQADCGGVLTFTANAGGGTGTYTYTFKDEKGATIKTDGPTANMSSAVSYGPVLDGTCHTVSVSVVDSAGCPSTPASVAQSVKQCVTSTAC